MEILNCLAQQRGYKLMYPPQQHGIPLKPGAIDDKYVEFTHTFNFEFMRAMKILLFGYIMSSK